jgi:hypothetical protein
MKDFRKEPALLKEIGTRPLQKKMLIVCEGKNTEVDYFDKFHIPGITIVPVGTGLSTSKLVREVESIKALQLKRKKLKKFDEVWVVFDKDDNKDFDDAIRLALSLKYKVAYTNQAFEYWFVLHFVNHQGNAMPRTDYAELINKYLKQHGAEYDPKSKHVSDEMFDVLWAFLQDAYDRATRILENKKKLHKEFEESVTTVQTLIHSINGMTTTKEKRQTIGKQRTFTNKL